MQPTNFIAIPESVLPNGLTVPAFRVARYLATAGELNPAGAACTRLGDRAARQAAVTEDGYPWVSINYAAARKAAAAAGFALITESQALALAWMIAQQPANWTGGAVGNGALFQGLHADSVDCPMPASYQPPAENERRWHRLSNGENIFDFAGNAYTWVFDDIQGDEHGVVAKGIAADSITLQSPYPSGVCGVGYRPDGARDWSGYALVRGGCCGSESCAGVFNLGNGWPGSAYVDVGFRCTLAGL